MKHYVVEIHFGGRVYNIYSNEQGYGITCPIYFYPIDWMYFLKKRLEKDSHIWKERKTNIGNSIKVQKALSKQKNFNTLNTVSEKSPRDNFLIY